MRFAIFVLLLTLPLQAEVTRVEVTSVKPWLAGRPFGKAGPYEILQGRIHFAVDPASPANSRITDIALAPRNASGRVEFSSDFVILRPRDPARSRGSVLFEIPNRGVTQANGMFFTTARGSAFNLMNLDATSLADAFLFEQGFTAAWLGWQFDLPEGAIRLEAPAAPVNSIVRESIIVGSAGTHYVRLNGVGSYCAADTPQPAAQLTVRDRFDEAPRPIPHASWQLADSCAVIYRDGFDPGRIYELTYEGAHPPLAGLGEAAVRDFASWLKFGSVPAAPRVIAYGYSQSARFLRDFLYRGFNADERGRKAFDAMFIASAGAGRGSFDHRYAMPGEAGNSVLSNLRPVDLFPFTDDGLLRAAEESHTLPKIFYTFSSTEYWARAGSLTYTTVDARRELPFNADSRLYFFAGTPHAFGPFPPIRESYSNLVNFASSGREFRALLLDLDDWAARNTKPPDSAYPHLGPDLVARERVTFPKIPGAEFPGWMPRNWPMDYGPDFASKGIISIDPPKLGAPYPILVPQTNRDGIDAGGILIPEVAVPLGTFTGWNYLIPVHPNLDYLGGLVGSFIPLSLTATDRKAAGDTRLSIAERYAGREGYLDKIRAAAKGLVSRRLLRAEDVPAVVAESAAHWDYLTRPDK
jgi:hypothetical protein